MANAAIVPAGSPSGGISVYNNGPSATDVVIDLNGYFASYQTDSGPALVGNTGCTTLEEITCTSSPGVSNTGATILVAYIGSYAGAPASSWITDSSGNTWSAGNCTTPATSGSLTGMICYVPSPTVSGSQTFTCTNGFYNCVLMVASFSGVQASSPLDSTNEASGTSSPFQPGSIALSTNELAVTGVFANIINTSNTISSSFTVSDTIGGSYTFAGSLAYWVGSGTVNPNWTLSLNTADVIGSIASFHHQ